MLFWKEPLEIRAEVINVIEAPEIPREKLAGLLRLGRAALATFITVEESKTGLLFIDNRLVRELAPERFLERGCSDPREAGGSSHPAAGDRGSGDPDEGPCLPSA